MKLRLHLGDLALKVAQLHTEVVEHLRVSDDEWIPERVLQAPLLIVQTPEVELQLLLAGLFSSDRRFV